MCPDRLLCTPVLALLLHVQILSLFHPHRALVDGVEARVGQRYGGERFVVEVAGQKRAYRGSLWVEDGGTELRLVNEVELEDYVASVVAAELGSAPAAARDALAIVARSFAVRADRAGHLCDTTHCQWYRGLAPADPGSAQRTRGEVLLLPDGRPAPAFHSQDCGGETARARDVWPGAGSDEDLASQRAPDPHPTSLPAGHGHGVGLCQRGAVFQASKGASAHQILSRYFPRLHIGRL
jgi:peptidoglycan hydrolase-like amidase